jgi:hypothetical protein
MWLLNRGDGIGSIDCIYKNEKHCYIFYYLHVALSLQCSAFDLSIQDH